MFKLNLVIGAMIGACLVAMSAVAEENGRWDYLKMENRVSRVCAGRTGNWVFRFSHPQLTARALYRNWANGPVFVESILRPQAANLLLDITQAKMTASESCFEVSGQFLTYELLGFEALDSLRVAFNDSGITENCEHVHADDQLRALYLACSKMEPAEKFLAETGGKLMFSDDMIMSVRKRIANKLLIERRPRTCNQIEELDEDLYRGFAAAQRKFRKKLKIWGYMKSIYSPDWS